MHAFFVSLHEHLCLFDTLLIDFESINDQLHMDLGQLAEDYLILSQDLLPGLGIFWNYLLFFLVHLGHCCHKNCSIVPEDASAALIFAVHFQLIIKFNLRGKAKGDVLLGIDGLISELGRYQVIRLLLGFDQQGLSNDDWKVVLKRTAKDFSLFLHKAHEVIDVALLQFFPHSVIQRLGVDLVELDFVHAIGLGEQVAEELSLFGAELQSGHLFQIGNHLSNQILYVLEDQAQFFQLFDFLLIGAIEPIHEVIRYQEVFLLCESLALLLTQYLEQFHLQFGTQIIVHLNAWVVLSQQLLHDVLDGHERVFLQSNLQHLFHQSRQQLLLRWFAGLPSQGDDFQEKLVLFVSVQDLISWSGGSNQLVIAGYDRVGLLRSQVKRGQLEDSLLSLLREGLFFEGFSNQLHDLLVNGLEGLEFEIDEGEDLLGGFFQLGFEGVVNGVEPREDLWLYVLEVILDETSDLVLNDYFPGFILNDIFSFGDQQLLGQLLGLFKDGFYVFGSDCLVLGENVFEKLIEFTLIFTGLNTCKPPLQPQFRQIDSEVFIQGVLQIV